MRKFPLLVLFSLLVHLIAAQPTEQLSSAQIRQLIKKSQVLGTVLYLAAHPDDENTRMITYLANEEHYRTGYLSLTRGDGGQNLVGTEKGALMGVLRTQELLEARKLDGGEQFFTRAVDFGYSKTPDETLEIWEKDKVLADVVRVIREFRPDVIITRFPPTSRAGHGHHTTSALLAEEAFDLANDPNAYPEQLETLEPWQPKRLLFNTSTWWDKTLPEQAKESKEIAVVDIGKYNPLLGASYSEIAAMSRSQHKSQGFGSSRTRGSRQEYLKHVKGTKSTNGDLMDGVVTDWSRVPGSDIDNLRLTLQQVEKYFNMDDPAASVPKLVAAYKMLNKLEDSPYVKLKKQEIQRLIFACAGIYLEALASEYQAVPGDSVELRATIINRSENQVTLKKVQFPGAEQAVNESLNDNAMKEVKMKLELPADLNAQPYWLRKPFDGVFEADDKFIGMPENPAALTVDYTVNVAGQDFMVKAPVYYKWTDRVDGELYRPFVPMPPVTINLEEKVLLFPDAKPQEVRVHAQAHRANISGKVELDLPKGWRSMPEAIGLSIPDKGKEMQVTFMVYPDAKNPVGEVKPKVTMGNTVINQSLVTIEYPHILPQTLLPEATARVVRINLEPNNKKVGYIMGAGDEVPVNLEQIGFEVTLLDEDNLRSVDLSQFDAILTGIRAFNTNKYLSKLSPRLKSYVANGGTFMVQYNTNRGLVTDEIGPYPFKLSRNRVTKEEATATLLDPEHPVFNTPNKLTLADFDGWVQERGLYFAGEWDDQYTPLIAWNDPGEEPQKGGLLVAEYGKGVFVYTGISFFRQLPAGVPGAFRLLSNLIHLQNSSASNGQ